MQIEINGSFHKKHVCGIGTPSYQEGNGDYFPGSHLKEYL
jgi:hypothetical protein